MMTFTNVTMLKIGACRLRGEGGGIIGDRGRRGGRLAFYKGHFNKPNLFYIEESLSSIDCFIVLDLIAT